MNKVIMMGRLTKDPDNRTTGNGTSVCSFSIAVDRRYRDADGNRQADFFNVVAWRQLADVCGKYLAKGRQVMVEGNLQNRSYEKDGQKHYLTEIIAENIEFVGGRNDSPAQQQRASTVPEANSFTEVTDDDLPF